MIRLGESFDQFRSQVEKKDADQKYEKTILLDLLEKSLSGEMDSTDVFAEMKKHGFMVN